MQHKKSYINRIFIAFLALIALNSLSALVYERFDLTRDSRYTLSGASESILSNIDKPIIIDVLLGGKIPGEFKRLQTETRHILEEFSAINPHIKFSFIDPLEEEATRTETVQQLRQLGLTPATVTREEGAKVSRELLFPWALANYGEKTVRVSLLKNKLGATPEARINNSVQALEYAFTDAFVKLTATHKKKVAVLKGNGELADNEMADFIATLGDYYDMAPFTLDSAEVSPRKTLTELKAYDLVLAAKPTEAFTDTEKYVLDQYLLGGGKFLWLIDRVAIEMEDMYNEEGKALALPLDLNLGDLFFRYGFRINPVLINDLYCTQIVLATGTGNDAQYNPVPWVYAPMVFSKNDHPVNTHIEALRFQFASSIDTLANAIDKTILLSSSSLSKTVGVPTEIRLEQVKKAPDRSTYTKGAIPVAVLLKGRFTSAFKNRTTPFSLPAAREEGEDTGMIVVSDGDLIRNDMRNGQPLELGYDKWTNNFYGNKEFLLNCVNYLLDDTGVIQVRAKKLTLAFLDRERTAQQKILWQFVNIGGPMAALIIFGGVWYRYRKKKYAR